MHVFMYVCIQALRNRQDVTQGQLLRRVKLVCSKSFQKPCKKNLVYPVCYLPICGVVGRTNRFMFFVKALAWNKTQTTTSMIWTQFAVYITYDAITVTLSKPFMIYIYIYIYIYIIVLVVTKSLCGFVSNQVQYNIESAHYLG